MSKKRESGVLLVEIIISLVMLSLIAVTIFQVFGNSLRSSINTKEQVLTQLLINQKVEEIKGFGFWVWSVDTAAPAFPSSNEDLAVIWKDQLVQKDFLRQGTIVTTFQKEVSGNLVDFSGQFDGDNTRNIAKVTVSLETSTGGNLSESFSLIALPAPSKRFAMMYILQKALRIYYTETSNYPTANLSDLVPTYLNEIPNDPYTSELSKNTHTEEAIDWHYTHYTSSNNIVIYPYSNPAEKLSWTY